MGLGLSGKAAALVIFPVSQAAGYISGATIRVDGGLANGSA
jgi:hypothetical protein